MKNSILYIFGHSIFGFFINLLSSQIALGNGTGNPFANTFCVFGFFFCSCGLLVETYKGVLNLINPNK